MRSAGYREDVTEMFWQIAAAIVEAAAAPTAEERTDDVAAEVNEKGAAVAAEEEESTQPVLLTGKHARVDDASMTRMTHRAASGAKAALKVSNGRIVVGDTMDIIVGNSPHPRDIVLYAVASRIDRKTGTINADAEVRESTLYIRDTECGASSTDAAPAGVEEYAAAPAAEEVAAKKSEPEAISIAIDGTVVGPFRPQTRSARTRRVVVPTTCTLSRLPALLVLVLATFRVAAASPTQVAILTTSTKADAEAICGALATPQTLCGYDAYCPSGGGCFGMGGCEPALTRPAGDVWAPVGGGNTGTYTNERLPRPLHSTCVSRSPRPSFSAGCCRLGFHRRCRRQSALRHIRGYGRRN